MYENVSKGKDQPGVYVKQNVCQNSGAGSSVLNQVLCSVPACFLHCCSGSHVGGQSEVGDFCPETVSHIAGSPPDAAAD